MQLQRFILLFSFSTLISVFSIAQPAGATDTVLSLKQAVEIAVKNNLQVRQNQISMEQSFVAKNQAIDYLLPNISANGSQGENYGKSINPTTYTYVNQQSLTGSYSLSGSLVLFSGLQNQNGIRQYKYAYDASKLDWQQQKDNITLNVILGYLQILSNQELLDIARDQVEVDRQTVERLTIQNNEGAIAPSALSDVQGKYASDKVNVAAQANALEAAKINLFAILNIPYQRNMQYQKIDVNQGLNDYPSDPDSIYQTALNTLPAIRSAALRIRSFQSALRAARGVYYPTLSLQASINSNYSDAATNSVPLNSFSYDTTNLLVNTPGSQYGVIQKNQNYNTQRISFGDQFKNNRYTYIGLSLNIPILNYLRARNNVKLAKINLENSRINENYARNQLQQYVELAYQNMVLANSSYKLYQDQVTAYAESFHSAEIRFKEGVITSVDYVIAKNNIDQASSNLTAAKYNYIFRTKILDYYQGKLRW